MLTKHIHAKVRENAETAIAEAEKLIASETLDEKAMADAKVELDSVVTNINASDAVFADFAEAIDYAEKVRGWYEDDVNKFNKMDAAIEVAQVAYDNVDLTAEEIERATQTLENVTKVVDKKVYTAKWSMGDVSNQITSGVQDSLKTGFCFGRKIMEKTRKISFAVVII